MGLIVNSHKKPLSQLYEATLEPSSRSNVWASRSRDGFHSWGLNRPHAVLDYDVPFGKGEMINRFFFFGFVYAEHKMHVRFNIKLTACSELFWSLMKRFTRHRATRVRPTKADTNKKKSSTCPNTFLSMAFKNPTWAVYNLSCFSNFITI